MNRLPENNNSSIVPFETISLPDGFDACWAGPNPLQAGLCVGSTNGMTLFKDEEGRNIGPPAKGSASGEAINGVARTGAWLGVSTRQEVNFWPIPGTVGGHTNALATPHGAHGITTTASGYFIAPLGRTGIMMARPPSVTVHSDKKEGLYAYRVISLRSEAGREVLACAAREGGMVFGEFSVSGRKHKMTTAPLSGLDIVDICPLWPESDSLAVAALGRDGSLVLFRELLPDEKPVRMKFQRMQGVAYRLLSCRGDLYLLTSKALYVLGKLAERFLAQVLVKDTVTSVLPLAMEAVDMNLVDNRWLLVVMPDIIRRFDVNVIHQSIPENLAHGEIREFQWTGLSPATTPSVKCENDRTGQKKTSPTTTPSPKWEGEGTEQTLMSLNLGSCAIEQTTEELASVG